MGARHPLPYAWAKTYSLLIEDDGQRRTLHVTDGTSRFANVDRPKVTVKRGALGSFFLDIEGVNPAPRVRRVE